MHRLVATLDVVRATRSRKAKVAALSDLFKSLAEDELAPAARLVLGQLQPVGDERALGVGWATVFQAAAAVSGRSEADIGAVMREVGDLGDALARLLPATEQHLPLRELPALIDALAATGDRAKKHELLEAMFRRAAPAEVGYLTKALLGELRIGVQRGILEEALALAAAVSLDVLRKASALTPDVGALAERARAGTLESAPIVIGQPIAFMLAAPLESVKEPLDLEHTVVEDKLDGIRAQAHVGGSPRTVRLFARGQGDITVSFPEVVRGLEGLAHDVILDGEILAVWPDGRSRPFMALQARLGRVAPAQALVEQVPVTFVPYDVLFAGEPLLDQPWHQRRARLETLGLPVNPVGRLDASQPLDAQLDARFAEARGRGNEGLMLKHDAALYEAGRRGAAWRKVKRALATLDCVITRAEYGHGKRHGVLSDYTFAVWHGSTLVEIGKAYSGLTDQEIAALMSKLLALTTGQAGHQLLIKPELVLEVAFDGLQKSSRHSSGFALRFPRIARVRDDKAAAQADTLETVRALFDAQVKSGHREDEA